VKKHLLLLAAVAAGMLATHAASAQVFGQLGGARPLDMNSRLFGAYAGFSKSESELFTQLRLSFYPGVDFGFQGGLSRVSVNDHNRTTVKLGGDFKAAALRAGESSPIDLSLGAALGVSSAEDFNLLGVGPEIVASRTWATGSGSNLTAYSGLVLLFTRSDLAGSNNTDVSVPIRLGLSFEPNQDLRLLAEVTIAASDQINDDLKLTVGANFPF
jgi:opacity protein-like surface antigen